MTGRLCADTLEGRGIDCTSVLITAEYMADDKAVDYHLWQAGSIRPHGAGRNRIDLGKVGRCQVDSRTVSNAMRKTHDRYDNHLRDLKAAQDADDAAKVKRLRENAFGDLQRSGANLAETLLPETLRRYLRILADEDLLLVYSDVDWIPWELLWLSELGDFLGGKFVIVRQGYRQKNAPNQTNNTGKACWIADDCWSEDEAAFADGALGLRCEELIRSKDKTRQELVKVMEQSRTMGLLCHIQSGQACLCHRDHELEYSKADAEFFQSCGVGDSILLMLSCRSLHEHENGGTKRSFGRDFTSTYSFRAFVGSLLDTYTREAVAVSNSIAQHLDEGKSIGKSLLEAKSALRTDFPGVVFYGLCGEWDLLSHTTQVFDDQCRRPPHEGAITPPTTSTPRRLSPR